MGIGEAGVRGALAATTRTGSRRARRQRAGTATTRQHPTVAQIVPETRKLRRTAPRRIFPHLRTTLDVWSRVLGLPGPSTRGATATAWRQRLEAVTAQLLSTTRTSALARKAKLGKAIIHTCISLLNCIFSQAMLRWRLCQCYKWNCEVAKLSAQLLSRPRHHLPPDGGWG